MSTSYVYRNGVVHLNRPTYTSDVARSIKGTEVETIINRLEADAAVDIQAGTMTFNPRTTLSASPLTSSRRSKHLPLYPITAPHRAIDSGAGAVRFTTSIRSKSRCKSTRAIALFLRNKRSYLFVYVRGSKVYAR